MPATRDRFQQLYDIADSQCGMFTAKQAASVGYSTRAQAYHVQTEDWQREWRGIYRLRFYPDLGPTDLMTWYLWSSDRSGKPEGIFSHDTALELHELSTWSANRVHLTVPKDFKRRVVPKALRLHAGELRHFEITRVSHVPVTTPTRTILDMLQANSIPRHHLIEALQEARKRGLITPGDMTSQVWTDDERRLLQELSDEALTYTTED
jgi:predicted transcriptional regulator of viral defense system